MQSTVVVVAMVHYLEVISIFVLNLISKMVAATWMEDPTPMNHTRSRTRRRI